MNSAKALSSGVAGALTTLLVWVLNTYAHAAIPDFVQGAIGTLITIATVYFVPNSPGDTASDQVKLDAKA